MAIEDDDGFRMRIDEWPFRIVVRATDSRDGLAYAGWELPDAAALAASAAELDKAGRTIEAGSAAECADRRVRGLIRTTDPSGFVIELFHGPIYDHELFVSPTGVSGFVTGPNGMGHIVLGTPHLADSVDFYTNLQPTNGWTVTHIGQVENLDVYCGDGNCVIINNGDKQVILYFDGSNLHADFDREHRFGPCTQPLSPTACG